MERQKHRTEDSNPMSVGLEGLFSGGSQAVTVCSGPYAEQLPVGGESVARVRALYADRFDLDPLSQAVVDGNEVDDDAIVQAGQLLVFVRRAGEKGAARVCWQTQCIERG